MDIDLLSKMVKELILDEDRVVLPGLGAFVAEIVPATFSDKGYTINPPYRRLYFRSKPDDGDELVAFYASSNNIEQEMAQRIIRDFLSEMRDVLHEKKTVVFPGLGRLRATKENNLFFVADEDLDIYPEGFGLEPISLKTHTETRAQVAAAVVGLKSIIEDAPRPVEPDTQPVTEESPAVPEMESRSVAESEPVIVQAIEQETIDEAEIVVEPLPVAEHNVVPMIEIISEPSAEEPQAVLESEPEILPDPQTDESEFISEQSHLPEPVPEEKPTIVPVQKLKQQSVGRRFLKIVLWMAVIAAVLLIAFTLTARLNPELFDNILYTPEELEIVRSL